jgi:glutamyl-tRNA reductase
MLGELILVGVSHSTAPIESREHLALSPAQVEDLLATLVASPALNAGFALSTCCRTELYAVARDADEAETLLRAELGRGAGRSADLARVARTARGRRVAEHLLRVASGLESIALGEVEILGQLRRAGAAAHAAGTRGRILGRLIDHALATGRRVRHETDIGAGRSSIASVAVGLVRRHLGPATPSGALVIGTGDTGAKAARALRGAGLVVTVLAGRRPERACRLAAEVGGRVAAPEDLLEVLSETDVAVSCTGAPHQLISGEVLVDVVERRTRRELLVIDLAVPRDFDPATRALEGVRLYDLDDLKGEVGVTAGLRAAAIPAAEAIVTHEVERFTRWLAALDVVPTIKDLRERSELAVLHALRRSDLGAGAEEDLLRDTSEAIVKRLLHAPTLRLRAAAECGDAQAVARCVRELFQLDTPRLAADLPPRS